MLRTGTFSSAYAAHVVSTMGAVFTARNSQTAHTRNVLLAIFSLLTIVIAVASYGMVEHERQKGISDAALWSDVLVGTFVDHHFPELKSVASSADVERRTGRPEISAAFARKIKSFSLWTPTGARIYGYQGYQNPEYELDQLTVAPTTATGFRNALRGATISALVHPRAHADDIGPSLAPKIEIFSPIRHNATREITAIAHIHAEADALTYSNILLGHIGAISLGVLILLTGMGILWVVRHQSGYELASAAHSAPADGATAHLMQNNEQLRTQLVDNGLKFAHSNEQMLKRIGAELHDGPTQLIGLALLRMDGLRIDNVTGSSTSRSTYERTLDTIQSSLQDAMSEIRQLCSGLSLPGIERLELTDVIASAIRKHERRTGTQVSFELPAANAVSCNDGVKAICYRFVQEGLNNAFRHAGGVGQHIELRAVRGGLQVIVSDSGGGFFPEDAGAGASSPGGLGLPGLRHRIEAIGGTFDIQSRRNQGTRLVAYIPLGASEAIHG